jgi:hypothetical protein
MAAAEFMSAVFLVAGPFECHQYHGRPVKGNELKMQAI